MSTFVILGWMNDVSIVVVLLGEKTRQNKTKEEFCRSLEPVIILWSVKFAAAVTAKHREYIPVNVDHSPRSRLHSFGLHPEISVRLWGTSASLCPDILSASFTHDLTLSQI